MSWISTWLSSKIIHDLIELGWYPIMLIPRFFLFWNVTSFSFILALENKLFLSSKMMPSESYFTMANGQFLVQKFTGLNLFHLGRRILEQGRPLIHGFLWHLSVFFNEGFSKSVKTGSFIHCLYLLFVQFFIFLISQRVLFDLLLSILVVLADLKN